MTIHTPTEPALEQRAAQPVVLIPITVTMAQWGQANALVPELFAWLGQRGLTPAGPLFYRYLIVGDLGVDGDAPFRLEIGIPVARAVEGDDRVVSGEIPAGTYATITHHGHPDQLEQTCGRLEAWAAQEDITFATTDEGYDDVWGGRYEFFLTDPDVEPDLNNWKIEVAYLVDERSAQQGASRPDGASP